MLNEIVIMGRLTKDPELRYTTTNVPVCSFTVAVERDFGSEDGKKPADFIDCIAWRQTGEFVSKYFFKGAMIAVTGRLESSRWQDRDGNKRTSWEINADHVYFGGSKTGGESGQQQSASPPPAKFTDIDPDEDDGELPF